MPDIRFSYQPLTAGSHEVGIAGDFTGWEILELADIGGVYVLTLHVETGKHLYKLIVDGIWMPDPSNPETEADPFGGENSLLIVEQEVTPALAWDEVKVDLGLLHDRGGHYLSLNRISQTEYELRFTWYPSLPAELCLILGQETLPLYRLGAFENQDIHHCLFSCEEEAADIIIGIRHGEYTLYYGTHGFSKELGEAVPHHIKLSAIPVFAVPQWVQEGIIYQIFPDRFCNGDPDLDPDFSEWYYDDCRNPPPPGELLQPQQEYYHLVRDWNDIGSLTQNPYLEKGKPDWWSFYGGDIPGIRSKLDYLKELGITIIYFNPLWQAKSNHKYDAADFRRIDPHFGSTAQMIELVEAAHELGIRLILDVAFNHTGEAFWAFRDCADNGPASHYWNWYDWHKWPLPKPLPPDFDPREYYQCWWGIKDMPDLNYDLARTHPSENYVKDIRKAIPNAVLVDYLLDSVTWWLKDIGIDGFRLDVPDEVPYWFWQLFRKHVKSVKPDAWIVGEIWYNAQGWVNHRYFDAVMNYAYFKNPVLEYFIFGVINRERFQTLIEAGLAQYPIQALRCMMNLLGSHDTWRIIELAKGDTNRLKLALLFQMTFIGTPHIYYGDEIGLEGRQDPDNRRPFNWNWEQDPRARDLHSYYIELIRLRRNNEVLIKGEFAFLELQEGLLGYQRYWGKQRLRVIINPSGERVCLSDQEKGECLFRLGSVSISGSSLELGSFSAVILKDPEDQNS